MSQAAAAANHREGEMGEEKKDREGKKNEGGGGEKSGNVFKAWFFNLGRKDREGERERGTGHYMVHYTERSPHRLEGWEDGGGERGGEERGCSELAPSPPPLLGSAQGMITSDCLLPDFTAELRRITTIFKNLQSK